MDDDEIEPTLNDVFLEEAAEVWHEAYQWALNDAGFQAGRPRWESLSAQEREATKRAVAVLVSWLD